MCGDPNFGFFFKWGPSPFLTLNYLVNSIFKNVDVPNSKCKLVVVSQLLKCL